MDYEKLYKDARGRMREFFDKYLGVTLSEDGEMYKDLVKVFNEQEGEYEKT